VEEGIAVMIDEDMQHAVNYGKALERSRAVFAQTDYALIKDALLFYAAHQGLTSEAEMSAISNLVHRLGRVDK